MHETDALKCQTADLFVFVLFVDVKKEDSFENLHPVLSVKKRSF